ncbi:hypothetical protein ACFWIA_34245 [Streptomyces sp. NPDC127068]|uniref:hypothetical protein n=1 Tax=Streptomyces sp. NPDC127068 TaxID=3347127 RepID=UPI003647BA64
MATDTTKRKSTAIPLWLAVLFLTMFTFSTDDHVIAGILSEVAAGLSVSEAMAGQLVTVPSLTVAAVIPVAGLLVASTARRTVVLAALAVFTPAHLREPHDTGARPGPVQRDGAAR